MRAFLATVRSLGKAGLEIDVAPFDWKSPALHSRYISNIHYLPHPSQDPRRWAEETAEIVKRRGYDLIVPMCERSLLPLVKYEDLFEPGQIAHPGRQALAAFIDKAETKSLALACNVPVAPGRLLRTSDNADNLIDEFDLPIVIKNTASYRIESLDYRSKVSIARKPEQLSAALADLDPAEPHLVEGYFPPSGKGQGVGVSVLASKGTVLIAFQHARLLEPAGGGGSSIRISEQLDPQLLEACRSLAQRTVLNGVAMFEFRRDRVTGEAILVEVNPRFWGSLPLAIFAGVDFPCMLYEMLVKGKQPKQPDYRIGCQAQNLVNSVYDHLFRSEGRRWKGIWSSFTDIGMAALKGVGLGPRNLCFDSFDRKDFAPGFREITALPRVLVGRINQRKQKLPESRNVTPQS
ncbi:carboxylate--amine ligase [Chelativorans sp. YIM 93263]|uniref:carboxylate--amine ligase n=1 Tax=Chelativorans sp. YIM 93263 TaxID=2906648 RepID=UPI0023789FD3|nr:ATP-grasp domain-containing protein [Chelativorans sp. YIM 93263]